MRGTLKLAAVAASMVAAGCGTPLEGLGFACTDEGWPSVVVDVRDGTGTPAARGATLVIRDGEFVDSAGPASSWNGLTLGAGNRRAGRYSVEVTKPGYHPAVLQRVVVPAGPCGARRPVRVAVQLELLPDAPAVRSVVVSPPSIWLGLPEIAVEMDAYVDAAPGVERGVLWSTSDTTVARISPDGRLVSQCRGAPGSAVITATAVADTSVWGVAHVGVAAVPTSTAGISPESARLAAEECLRRLREGE